VPLEAVKPLGVISIGLACTAGWFLLRRWPQGRASSISRHAGRQRTSYFLFASTLTLCGLLFSLFMWRWFGPTIGADWPFYVFLGLAIIFQLLTAWLPDNGQGGKISQTHGLVAFSMALMMQLLVACVALAPDVQPISRMTAWLVFTLMAIFWYLFLFVKRSRGHFLIFQTLYIASFYVVIVLASYVR
jgi:hypothetical protein